MKTLTEFSTLTLRKAAAARAAVGGAPRPVAAAPEASEASEAPASETPAEGEAPAEAAPEAAAPDPAIEGVASALGVQADRAARLLEALDVVGTENLDNIRLVRVFQGETGPHNAVSRGEFHYVVDRVAGAGGQRRRAQPAGGSRAPRAGR